MARRYSARRWVIQKTMSATRSRLGCTLPHPPDPHRAAIPPQGFWSGFPTRAATSDPPLSRGLAVAAAEGPTEGGF